MFRKQRLATIIAAPLFMRFAVLFLRYRILDEYTKYILSNKKLTNSIERFKKSKVKQRTGLFFSKVDK